MGWINFYNLTIVVLMLIPNIIYAFKNKDEKNNCTNRLMNIIEQIGRYGCMFLMVFNIGIYEFGFNSKEAFLIWLFVIPFLLLLYWVFWVFYFKSHCKEAALALAIIPSIIFIFTGILLRHWLLVIFGFVFSVSHIYVTYQNNKEKHLGRS